MKNGVVERAVVNAYGLLAPLLFRFAPEPAHRAGLLALRLAQRLPGSIGLATLEALFAVRHPRLAVEVFGLRFPNAVGLAAGLDKDAHAPAAFAALGCGFVEVGTVTPRAQPGNPRPRLFRLPSDTAIINRLGFPSEGIAAVRARLWPWRHGLPGGAVLGVNLGKNATTPIEEAARDYLAVFDGLHDLADYVVINVSSPNTPGLRALQTRALLTSLAGAVVARRDHIARATTRRIPVLVKISPDLDESGLTDVVAVAHATGIDGLIATNTTISRPSLTSVHATESGGLSGVPLRARAIEVLTWLVREAGPTMPVVAVGGIMTPEDARARLDAGARLVQTYTGMVYAGPGLPGAICRVLLRSH